MTHDFPEARRIESRESFSAIRERLVGKYAMSEGAMEALCPDAEERAMVRELLIRAHFDPDFRFDLIWNVEEALAQLPNGCPKALRGIRFRDDAWNAPHEIEFNPGEHCIRLMAPEWQDLLARENLEAMIDNSKPEVPGNGDANN